MMKSFKLALVLGVALGASAANTMARESGEGPHGGDPDAIVRPSDTIARERSEGPRGRDPRAIVDQQWDKIARRGEAPRGEDDEGNDIGDDHGTGA